MNHWTLLWVAYIVSALMIMISMDVQRAVGFVITFGIFLALATIMLKWEPNTRESDELT
ncbi:MAG: hypothetical protein QMC77_00205 [Methanocellales archaeon]|nr:hypothetical protein [Methanocellales archaeon]MDI6902149.1 hypothetical protein [Methanocellales archaeon]